MLKIKMSPLSDVLSHLSDEINMQEDLPHEMCPHKPEFPFIRVPITQGGGGGTVLLLMLLGIAIYF